MFLCAIFFFFPTFLELNTHHYIHHWNSNTHRNISLYRIYDRNRYISPNIHYIPDDIDTLHGLCIGYNFVHSVLHLHVQIHSSNPFLDSRNKSLDCKRHILLERDVHRRPVSHTRSRLVLGTGSISALGDEDQEGPALHMDGRVPSTVLVPMSNNLRSPPQKDKSDKIIHNYQIFHYTSLRNLQSFHF